MQRLNKKTVRKIILLLLALLAVSVLVYLFVVRPIQVRQEKKQFEQAAAELEKLYTQIEAVAGKPDQIKREKSCGRANLKGARGPVSCDVQLSFLFDDVGPERATSLRDSVSSLKAFPVQPESSDQSKNFTPEDSLYSQQAYFQHYKVNNFSCGISYKYPARPGEYEPFVPASQTGLVINISCGKPTLAEHYPLQN